MRSRSLSESRMPVRSKPATSVSVLLPIWNVSSAFAPKIQYFDHKNSFEQMAPFFPGLKQEDLPDGESWAVEEVQLNTHNGTHLDAPYHFASTQDGGQRALTIDEVGMAKTAEDKLKIATRLVEFACGQYGLAQSDLMIDPLTFTIRTAMLNCISHYLYSFFTDFSPTKIN